MCVEMQLLAKNANKKEKEVILLEIDKFWIWFIVYYFIKYVFISFNCV